MAYEHLNPDLQAMIGTESAKKLAPVMVDRSLLDHWVEAYQDSNPLYSDEEFAKKSHYGSLVAPPGMIMSWGLDFYWKPKTGPVNREEGMIYYTVKRLLDCPVGINTGTTLKWFKPVLLGDHISYTEMITDVSEKKTTRLGTGYWVTYKTLFRNQRDELVSEQSAVNFIYVPTRQ